VAQQIGAAGGHAHFSVTAGGVLAYRTGPGNKSQLTWLDRAGKVLDTAGDPGQYLVISLSPDEKQVAIFRSNTQGNAGDIGLLDLARNIETRLTTGQTVAGTPYGPVWSPDGKQLAYVSGNGIYIKDAGGATDAKLVKNLGRPVFVTDWTRDGRFLIYDELERGGGAFASCQWAAAILFRLSAKRPLQAWAGYPPTAIGSRTFLLAPDGRRKCTFAPMRFPVPGPLRPGR
jgi:hypothetical protein